MSGHEVDIEQIGSQDSRRVAYFWLELSRLLGELAESLVVVGGLVPSLLAKGPQMDPRFSSHEGTRDLDLVLQAGMSAENMQLFAERLRLAGFQPRLAGIDGRPGSSWSNDASPGFRLDLLVPAGPQAAHRQLQSLGNEVFAVAMDGLEYALEDVVVITVWGTSAEGGPASAPLPCCGPAAFTMLKSLAFRSRLQDKDIYDLVYLLRFIEGGPASAAPMLRTWLDRESAVRQLDYLRQIFKDLDADGPESFARFFGNEKDFQLRVMAHSTMLELFRAL